MQMLHMSDTTCYYIPVFSIFFVLHFATKTKFNMSYCTPEIGFLELTNRCMSIYSEVMNDHSF